MFSHLILQQSNMALMLMGKTAHPETGQVTHDLDSAKLFIDQLEVLEEKTRGNLTKEETGLFKQVLTNLRMAFVESVETAPTPSEPAPATKKADPASESPTSPATGTDSSTEEEHRKKFSKKY